MLLARRANFSLSKSRPQIANRFALARTASILRSSASRLRRAASSASASAARASLNGRSKHHKRPSRRNQVVVATASRNARSCDTSTNAPRYALRNDSKTRIVARSRWFVGSSSNSRSGSAMTARANIKRFCCPPDSSPARKSNAALSMPSSPSSASARQRSSLRSGSPSSTASTTLRRAVFSGRNCSTRPTLRPRR